MTNPKPHHNGNQDRTYRRGADYIRNIARAKDVRVGVEGNSRADQDFACRHRDEDHFRFAEALARCSVILNNANEKAVTPSDRVQKLANDSLAGAFGHLVKWEDGQY